MDDYAIEIELDDEKPKVIPSLPHRPIVRAAKEEECERVLAELLALEPRLPTLTARFSSIFDSPTDEKRTQGRILYRDLAKHIHDLVAEAKMLVADVPERAQEVARLQRVFVTWGLEIKSFMAGTRVSKKGDS